ncbi:MAG: hypothetical protein CMH47_13055 [Muricauda sp.]|nr:hypothetical protein [Allomuricauda sp.]|tara:strand:+ start:2455 stop:2748 length:294 start_codon:yes stop_codon:yes gene_type:complete
MGVGIDQTRNDVFIRDINDFKPVWNFKAVTDCFNFSVSNVYGGITYGGTTFNIYHCFCQQHHRFFNVFSHLAVHIDTYKKKYKGGWEQSARDYLQRA